MATPQSASVVLDVSNICSLHVNAGQYMSIWFKFKLIRFSSWYVKIVENKENINLRAYFLSKEPTSAQLLIWIQISSCQSNIFTKHIQIQTNVTIYNVVFWLQKIKITWQFMFPFSVLFMSLEWRLIQLVSTFLFRSQKPQCTLFGFQSKMNTALLLFWCKLH